MNLQAISQTFAQTLEIKKVEFHPPVYGNHDVSVFFYFPYNKLLVIYCMSMDVYKRLNAENFWGYLYTTFYLPVEASDIIEAEAEAEDKKCPF